jgi:uncharacterized Fe-S cluster protein YjdI
MLLKPGNIHVVRGGKIIIHTPIGECQMRLQRVGTGAANVWNKKKKPKPKEAKETFSVFHMLPVSD